MSEDEQCGRWETTPEDLRSEVRRLRAIIADTVHALKSTNAATPLPFVTSLLDRLQRALDASTVRTKTD